MFSVTLTLVVLSLFFYGGYMKRQSTRRAAIVLFALGFGLAGGVAVAPTSSANPPYSSCKDAIADGAAPLFKGDPGYDKKLDPNGDGIACLAGSGATYFPPKN